MADLEPLAKGTRVWYHGSITSFHGWYVVDAVVDIRAFRADIVRQLDDQQITEYYPDGKGYQLWPEGVPQKFGNRGRSLKSVRRGSLSLEKPDDWTEPLSLRELAIMLQKLSRAIENLQEVLSSFDEYWLLADLAQLKTDVREARHSRWSSEGGLSYP